MHQSFSGRLPLTRISVALGAGLLLLAGAVASAGDPIAPQRKAGAPLAGLTQAEAERFELGMLAYTSFLSVEDGLGPIFNQNRCSDCHTNPIGGWGSVKVTHFGLADKGSFDPLTHLGGPILQVNFISESCQEVVPPEANVVAQRVTNSSMAFGMIEAIPDAAILALADPFDANGDGISGRAHMVQPVEAPGTLRVGRFGWKAQVATILTFSGDAARNELGLTNRLFPEENAPNGNLELLLECDTVPDIEDGPDEDGLHFIDRVTDFQRLLAPPPQTPRSGMSGELIFNAIGCAACHVPQWTTADDPTLPDAIRAKTIRPYSNFLLHDMGILGDGIVDGDAGELEMRTPTLWNLRTRDPMLHDGRVAGGSFEERIAGPTGVVAWHDVIGSEARPSAQAFFALSAADRAKVIAFLDSLGRLEFDADGNGFIGFVDFLAFQGCFGTTDVHPDDACAVHDIDQDGAITITDFASLLLVYEETNGDCNGDGVSDLEAILLGAPDKDGDGVPDNCLACPADLDGDRSIGASDLAILLGAWGTPGADIDGNGTTEAADLGILLGSWGACP